MMAWYSLLFTAVDNAPSSIAAVADVSTATGADVKEAPLQSFLNSIGKSAAGTIDERIVFDKILINKELASVWTPYQLYIKDKYMHQGVDSFQVVFTKEGWKIQYLIDTRYP